MFREVSSRLLLFIICKNVNFKFLCLLSALQIDLDVDHVMSHSKHGQTLFGVLMLFMQYFTFVLLSFGINEKCGYCCTCMLGMHQIFLLSVIEWASAKCVLNVTTYWISRLEVIIHIIDGKKKNPKQFKVELIFMVEIHYCFMLWSVMQLEHTFCMLLS